MRKTKVIKERVVFHINAKLNKEIVIERTIEKCRYSLDGTGRGGEGWQEYR